MDVSAILLIGSSLAEPDDEGGTEETVGGVPIAYLDVLGKPIVERVLLRLQHCGISRITLIGNLHVANEPFTQLSSVEGLEVQRFESSGEAYWSAAEDAFEKHRLGGADLVLALRIGSYVEIDYEDLIQHHLDKRCAVTAAVDSEGNRLDQFVLNASARTAAATLFRSRMRSLRKSGEPFRVVGYVNRLRDASDLRRLAVDGLLGKNSVQPQGRQIKPGVWVHSSANVHRKARIVAPVFIGAHAKIRASAVITRGSVVEHHAEVDCGTVVEDSTVLPFTYIGAGLDVVHSVSGFHHLTDLPRNTEVEIKDGKLLGMKALSPILRLVGITAAFFAFISREIHRGLVRFHRKRAADISESLVRTTSAPESPVMKAQEDPP